MLDAEMKRIYIYLICFLLLGGTENLFAQIQEKEAPRKDRFDYKELKKAPTRTKKREISATEIFELINEANTVAVDSPQKSFDLIEDALSLSFASDNKRSEAYCYNTLGAVNYQLSRYDISIDNYQKSINLFQEVGDEAGLYNSYKYLGSAYDGKEDYDRALNFYLLFLKKAIAAGIKTDIISTQKNIGRIYFNQGQYSLAKDRYLEVLRLEKESGNQEGVIDAYNYIGKSYDQMGREDSALHYFRLSESFATSTGDKKIVSKSLDNFSAYYNQKQQPEAELEVQQRALANKVEVNDIEGARNSNLQIGKIYLQQGNTSEALPYLKRSVDLSDELGELTGKTEAYEALAEAYEITGDFEKALTTLKASRSIADSVTTQKLETFANTIELNEDLSTQDIRISTLIKDQELMEEQLRVMEKEREVREANLRQQQWIIFSLIFGIFLLAVSGFFILRSYRIRRKANLLLALKSLRSQMNPHFIFNSLNSVNSFIAKNDDRSANKYLADFSKLMRSVMESSQEDFVPLQTEIQIIHLYLGLEHFRFSDKFDYSFEVDEEIPVDGMEIPPMLIQPYIENAIWHGLRYKEEKGFLRVEMLMEGDMLKVEIEDDGIGREKSLALKTKNQKAQKSTGLKNTAERLEIINTLYQKQITVDISDVENEGECCGTLVAIRIPVGKAEKIHS